MKRKDMVEYLHKLLNTYDKHDGQIFEPESADEILEGLEHMGMLPPATKVKSVMPGIDSFTVNKWEREDEA